MASLVFQQAICKLQSAGPSCSLSCHYDSGSVLVKPFPTANNVHFGFSSTNSLSTMQKRSGVIQASTSQMSVVDTVFSPSDNIAGDKPKKSKSFVFNFHVWFAMLLGLFILLHILVSDP